MNIGLKSHMVKRRNESEDQKGEKVFYNGIMENVWNCVYYQLKRKEEL